MGDPTLTLTNPEGITERITGTVVRTYLRCGWWVSSRRVTDTERHVSLRMAAGWRLEPTSQDLRTQPANSAHPAQVQ